MTKIELNSVGKEIIKNMWFSRKECDMIIKNFDNYSFNQIYDGLQCWIFHYLNEKSIISI